MLHTAMRLRITEADTSVRPCSTAEAPQEHRPWPGSPGRGSAADRRRVRRMCGKTWRRSRSSAGLRTTAGGSAAVAP